MEVDKLNKNELQAEMKRKGYNYATVAKALGISENAFWRKINGSNDFTLTEIQELSRLLELNQEKIMDIFLNVS